MKTKLTLTIPVLLIILSIGLFFQSCITTTDKEDCTPADTTVVKISDVNKSRVPYTGYDTLKFVQTSTGDTHTFIGQGPLEGYDLTTAIIGREDCAPDMALLEWLAYKFKSSTYPSSDILIDIYPLRYGTGPYMFIHFNDQKFYIPFAYIRQPYDFDSLVIGNRSFYEIIKFSTPSTDTPKDWFILYNTNYGVLQFKFNTGEEWNLIAK